MGMSCYLKTTLITSDVIVFKLFIGIEVDHVYLAGRGVYVNT